MNPLRDGLSSVEVGVTAADEEWPDGGVQQVLNRDEAGGVGADVFQEPESSTWSEYTGSFYKCRVGIGAVHSTNDWQSRRRSAGPHEPFGFPEAGIAVLTVPGTWKDIEDDQGRLVAYWSPHA